MKRYVLTNAVFNMIIISLLFMMFHGYTDVICS